MDADDGVVEDGETDGEEKKKTFGFLGANDGVNSPDAGDDTKESIETVGKRWGHAADKQE